MNRRLIIPAVIGGVLFLLIAIVYFADTAHALPSFFPGHVGAHSSEAAHHHVKHGIAALVLSFGCFVLAWFASGPRQAPPPRTA